MSREPLLRSVNVSRSVELTPKAKSFYKTARKLKNIAVTYKIRTNSFKQRLRMAKKHMTIVNAEAANFCIQQLSRKATKRRRMRYTFDEKLMALALYKTSGPAYRLL